MKLFLSSLGPWSEDDASLGGLAGKPLGRVRVAYIENAHDVYDDDESLEEGRASLNRDGYKYDLVDLRVWRRDRAGLAEYLKEFDVFLLSDGNPYYLRSLLKLTGADDVITERVHEGAIYAAAGGAAVMAGPTLRHFNDLDDPAQAEILVWEGLGLTDFVIAPHVDNVDFGEDCRRAGNLCAADGYTVHRLTDDQALLVNGRATQLLER